jgi:PKHD-type hydroxylase
MEKKTYKSSVALELKKTNYLDTYIIIPNVFSKEECEKIISMKGNKSDSTVYIGGNVYQADKKFRNSNSNFLVYNKHMEWFSKRLQDLVYYVNNEYFQFKLTLITDIGVVEYLKDGFFTKHLDIGKDKISLRKLSVVTFLSDPNDYEGGRLCFEPSGQAPKQERGSVVIFPSYLPHRVEPVTDGVRYTLVAWCVGPHFK